MMLLLSKVAMRACPRKLTTLAYRATGSPVAAQLLPLIAAAVKHRNVQAVEPATLGLLPGAAATRTLVLQTKTRGSAHIALT